ncbi:MAG: phosphotransferase [Ruminococcus sp.]|nr:phosphotransferase [Ruminococcus sp.]
MEIRHTLENGKLTLFLCGRIDTNNAAQAEQMIISAIEQGGAAEVIFDAGELEYISSAGLRVLMRVRKRTAEPPKILNTPPPIYEILDTTGFTELFEVKKKPRVISVEGCEVIGRGYYGTVYRVDPETVVKVYESPDSLSMIENETKLAKTALVAGVPTAIAYDIVRVGDSYGSVFELLNAKNFNDLLVENTGRVDEITAQYAAFLRLVNEQTVPAGRLRSAKVMFLDYLEKVKAHLSGELYGRLKMLLSEIPESHNVIHGDAQMKNIMVVDSEPMLIDMETLCTGQPIFDLQGLYVTYRAFPEDDPNNAMDFLGIHTETTAYIWQRIMELYFGTQDKTALRALEDKIRIVASIRFLKLLVTTALKEHPLTELRIKHTKEHLQELLARVDSLDCP